MPLLGYVRFPAVSVSAAAARPPFLTAGRRASDATNPIMLKYGWPGKSRTPAENRIC